MPIERSDVPPGDERDKLGRLMILRPVESIINADRKVATCKLESRRDLWCTIREGVRR